MKVLLVLLALIVPSISYAFNGFSSGISGTPIATATRNGIMKVDNVTTSVSSTGTLSTVRAYGELYTNDNSIAQTIPTGTTYTKANPFLTNGASLNTTLDHAAGEITINKSGLYVINFSFSSRIATNDVNLYTAAFANNVELGNVHSLRATKASNVSVSAASGFAYLTEGQKVDVRCRHDYGSSIEVTTIYANLNVRYIGP